MRGTGAMTVAAVCMVAWRCTGPEPADVEEAALPEEHALSPGDTLLVDDDREQCPEAPYRTIQAAVDAASPGDTVKVCPGTYAEDVVVPKTLRLLGARAGKNATKREVDLARESVVASGAPFNLLADNIVLDGFYVRELLDGTGDDDDEPGIKADGDVSGYRIQNNVIQSTTLGLFPRCSGAQQTLVTRNLFLGQAGIETGEIDGFGAAHNLLVSGNTFRDIQNAMVFFGAGDTDLEIIKNRLEGGVGIIFSSVTDTHVRQNKFQDMTLAVGIDNADRLVVGDNILRGGQQGISVGFGSSDILIEDNRMAGLADFGIGLIGTPPFLQSPGAVVSHNEVEDGGRGIVLRFAFSNEVVGNNVEDNRGPGIEVSADSVSNFIHDNEVRGNGPPDCQDASVDARTAGTANTWLNNEGSTSQPRGLCVDHVEPVFLDRASITLLVTSTQASYDPNLSHDALVQSMEDSLRWCRAHLATADGFGGPQSCHSDTRDIGTYLDVHFDVCQSATWEFRLGPDYGRGGVLYVDGQVVDSTTQDIWWDLSWDEGPQLAGSRALGPGTHRVETMGFEDCCAGAMGLQFRVHGGAWTDVSVANLAAAGGC